MHYKGFYVSSATCANNIITIWTPSSRDVVLVFVFGDEKAVRNDRYMHYLHHRYHNVNFGESNVPLDKWFGSLHDGSSEADLHFREVHRKRVQAQQTDAG